MKESRIIFASKKAKEDGYEYMTSVVKSVYNATYYNVNKIDDVLAAGKWIKSNYIQNWIPENSIDKLRAIREYCG